jgi:hypothetical protein
MARSRCRRPPARWQLAGVFGGLTCLLGSQACGKESRAETGRGSPAPVVSAVADSQSPRAGTPAPSASAPSHVKEQHFDLNMSARGPFRLGAPGEAEIVLVALGTYKVNQEYPIKYTLENSVGVDYPVSVVKRDRAKVEHARATMTVPFVPRAAGDQRIVGEFAFSVCTDQKCVLEKQALGVTVRVE